MGTTDACYEVMQHFVWRDSLTQFRSEVLVSLIGMIRGNVTLSGFAIEMWKQFQQTKNGIPF